MQSSLLKIHDHLPQVLIVALIFHNVRVVGLFGVEDLVDGEVECVVKHPRD